MREKTKGYKLDKSHIFSVNLFDDFEKYKKVPDEWTPAEIKPYTPVVILSSFCFETRVITIMHTSLLLLPIGLIVHPTS